MGDSLNVVIAAGGTAGHINPALALAEELRDRGHRVTFFGQTAKLEGTLVPEAGFDFVPIEVRGFDRSRPWTAVSALVRTKMAERDVAVHFARTGAPDVAVGFGAYVEVPLLSCAPRMGCRSSSTSRTRCRASPTRCSPPRRPRWPWRCPRP